MSLLDYLNQEAKIYNRVLTAGFEPVITWTLADTVPCMIDPLPMDKRYIQGAGKVIVADVVMYLDYTTLVTTDRVLVDDAELYEVISPDNPNSMGRHLEVYLKRLPAGTDLTLTPE